MCALGFVTASKHVRCRGWTGAKPAWTDVTGKWSIELTIVAPAGMCGVWDQLGRLSPTSHVATLKSPRFCFCFCFSSSSSSSSYDQSRSPSISSSLWVSCSCLSPSQPAQPRSSQKSLTDITLKRDSLDWFRSQRRE